jgi:CDP-glucose 4,6-dehydratase
MAFNNCFKGKKIIVTGHTGFKGAWLTTWLLQLGAEITGISKDIPTIPSLFEGMGLATKINHHVVNICDAKAINKIFLSVAPDFVFHLAAQPIVSVAYDDPVDTFQTNVIGTANILEALRLLNNHCTAVMITSDKCYDNVEWVWGYREHDALGGKDPYSASKGAAELVIKTYFHSYFSKPDSAVKLVTVRAGNVIGGGDWALNRIVPDCIRAWSEKKPVAIRNPNATRPWQHVLEPLSGYLRAAQCLHDNQKSINGEPFNFGPNADQNHTVLDLLRSLSVFWQFKNQQDHFAIENSHLFHEAGLLKLNCDKALFNLQWRPVLEFPQTSSFTGLWYNAFYNGANTNMYDFTIKQIDEYVSQAKIKALAWVN